MPQDSGLLEDPRREGSGGGQHAGDGALGGCFGGGRVAGTPKFSGHSR